MVPAVTLTLIMIPKVFLANHLLLHALYFVRLPSDFQIDGFLDCQVNYVLDSSSFLVRFSELLNDCFSFH